MKNINIKKSLFQSFPYHLVDPSPWPILVGFSVFSMAIGAVMSMHGFSNGGLLLNLGFIITVYGMILWFRDVISEGTLLGFHTKEVKNGLMIGFVLFVISEVFAFFSIFWAFFHSSLSPAIEIGGNWPPLGITPLDAFAIPLLNTFLLLSSGAFVTYGHHALIGGNRKGAIIGTFLTVVFAIIFTLLQYYGSTGEIPIINGELTLINEEYKHADYQYHPYKLKLTEFSDGIKGFVNCFKFMGEYELLDDKPKFKQLCQEGQVKVFTNTNKFTIWLYERFKDYVIERM